MSLIKHNLKIFSNKYYRELFLNHTNKGNTILIENINLERIEIWILFSKEGQIINFTDNEEKAKIMQRSMSVRAKEVIYVGELINVDVSLFAWLYAITNQWSKSRIKDIKINLESLENRGFIILLKGHNETPRKAIENLNRTIIISNSNLINKIKDNDIKEVFKKILENKLNKMDQVVSSLN